MKTTMVVLGVAAYFTTSTTAFGQPSPPGGWLVEVIGAPVTPANPTTTVRVSAYFPSNLWAFYTGGFDLFGTDTGAAFSHFMLPAPLGPRPPGVHGCVIMLVGGAIPGGVAQVGFLQENIVGCQAHPGNPLPIFEAQWTTNVFRPRLVSLETENTSVFSVFTSSFGNTVNLISTQQFRHGSAVIQVIPAPGGAALLLGASLAVWRRRRVR